jgi:hypothetical protein
MGMRSKWIRGNLVYYDSILQQRWLDAVGPTVVKFSDDYVMTPFSAADTPSDYVSTLIELGAGETYINLLSGTYPGGHLYITTDANDNDGVNIQVRGEAFLLDANHPCYFGIKFMADEASHVDIFAGLCITNLTLEAGMTDGVYFNKPTAATALNLVLETASTPTTTLQAGAFTANAWHWWEFIWNGTAIDSWVDGVLQTRPATLANLPQVQTLTPSIVFKNGHASIHNMWVHWMRAIQLN